MVEKITIVTGGSSGLGFELIKLLLEKNYQVINLSRKKPNLKLDNLLHIGTNFNCNQAIQRAIDKIYSSFEKIDYIF